jgi:UDP-N-acetylmuramyl pentapeptide synthase
MGVEHKGDLQYFASIVRPDIGIITYISPVHLVNFEKMDDLVEEKLMMTKIIKSSGRLIVNSDNEYLKSIDDSRAISVGISDSKAKYRAENIHLSYNGTDFSIVTVGQKIAIKSKLLGKQSIYSQLFAFALGQVFEIQSLSIKKSLESLKSVNGRMNFVEGRDGVQIIDDTYNASPASVKAALDTLANISYAGRKVAILGNMNELGSDAVKLHEEIGEYAKKRCDIAIFVGENAQTSKQAFDNLDRSYAFESRAKLLQNLSTIIKRNDLVLIKGSQNKVFLEEVTKRLMKNPENADKILVRQGSFWLRKKR